MPVVTDKKKADTMPMCSICNREFKEGDSYEEITTSRKSKLIIHTECVRKG